MSNYCFIDGQNLHLGTTQSRNKWKVDLLKFRVYLRQKYNVDKAFYHLGYVQEGAEMERLYENIQSAGFILVFRQHHEAMIGTKKGNVDSDIIFTIMKRIYLKEKFDNVVLVTGDGDYKMLVDFLIEINRLEKIVFPDSQRYSSLYKRIDMKYRSSLNEKDVMRKIELTKNNKKR
jgi:uncharacterized LabA/DUF88 family protein